jgi:hypothetical protein
MSAQVPGHETACSCPGQNSWLGTLADMKRKNRTSPKKRKPQNRKRSRITSPKRSSGKYRANKRRKVFPVSARKPITDPRIAWAMRLMRVEGFSASKAVRRVGMKLETLRRGAGRYLYRSGPGKPWKARKDDELPFLVTIPTALGPTTVVARNYRERRLAGAHDSAIKMWRAGADGSEAALKVFEGKTVGGYKLITDTKLLIQLEEAGQLDFENLYTPFGDES